MDVSESPDNERLLAEAAGIARDAAEPIPETEEILIVELRWEIDELVMEIADIIFEIDDVRRDGDGKPTPEKLAKIRAMRKKQDPLYARIKLCHERIAMLCNLYPNVSPCGHDHSEDEE